MGLSIEIDSFTPCLVEKSTGEIINTKYSVIEKSELESISKKGWKFNWLADDLKNTTVYKLTLDDSTNSIQGLVAVTDYPRDKALYINIAESAPHNIGKNKQYEGVGGHLFAIAANESIKKGYGGFLFMDAFPAIDPGCLAEILFTSGTTGVSKGVMISQKNLCAN
ncbi:MAG: AMP-binding protein, partial [Clostridia bacterium]|nr:AMP-binding protein [Clostridia bacterium]